VRGSRLKPTLFNVGQSRFRHLPWDVATSSLCAHYSYTLPGRARDVERLGVTIGRCLSVGGFDKKSENENKRTSKEQAFFYRGYFCVPTL